MFRKIRGYFAHVLDAIRDIRRELRELRESLDHIGGNLYAVRPDVEQIGRALNSIQRDHYIMLKQNGRLQAWLAQGARTYADVARPSAGKPTVDQLQQVGVYTLNEEGSIQTYDPTIYSIPSGDGPTR